MLSFFTPKLKIQKNRQVLRDTDERMAKYSRRGLMGNFIIFLLCMAVGTFVDDQPGLSIALTIGLLLTTLLRGYLLFRFDTLYPRAPNLWRTRYFYATLLGAGWWGLIVAIETLVVGIENEGPLLWLYTIVFFSMTANAFAPYKQFLTIYQALGLVPGAFCLLFTGDLTGVIYGIVVFFFIWLLHHQCEQIADNYWERLESSESLARKTESLEEEKRDTRATAQLNRDYMLLLKKELEDLLNAKRAPREDEKQENTDNKPQEIKHESSATFNTSQRRPRLEQLHSNVSDFYQIITKDIEFIERLFNPQALLHFIVGQYADEYSQKNIDLELSFSPNLPHLVLGDTERLTQITESILNAIGIQLEEGTLFIDVEYKQERGKIGDLSIVMNHQPTGNRTLFNAQQATGLQLNLELALAIGLAEAKNGGLDISSNNQGTHIRYHAPYANRVAVEPKSQVLTALKGRKVLLIHENPRTLDIKRQELSMLGLSVATESQFKKAITTLKSAINDNAPFCAVIFHSHADPKATADFSQSLLNEPSCKLVPQIIMGSTSAKDSELFVEIITSPYVHWLNKPATLSDFKQCFWDLFKQSEHLDEREHIAPQRVAIIGTDNIDSVLETLTSNGLEQTQFASPKALLQSLDKFEFNHVVFIDDGSSFIEIYAKLRENHPSVSVIACDTLANGRNHLQAGADEFINVDVMVKQLPQYIKTHA